MRILMKKTEKRKRRGKRGKEKQNVRRSKKKV